MYISWDNYKKTKKKEWNINTKNYNVKYCKGQVPFFYCSYVFVKRLRKMTHKTFLEYTGCNWKNIYTEHTDTRQQSKLKNPEPFILNFFFRFYMLYC